ncbi:MAG: hypothetical protein ACM3UZ_16935 [Acidobacteriota bacterium]
MVILFANQEDTLAQDVKSALLDQGVECVLLSPPGPASDFNFAWTLPGPTAGCFIHEGIERDQAELTGILVRALPEAPRISHTSDDEDYLRMEWSAAFTGWLRAVPALVVNRPRPGWSIRPPYLAAHTEIFAACGLTLADMIITDSQQEAESFIASHPGQVLLVPGGPAQLVPYTAGTPLPEGIIRLTAQPEGILQRVHVVGEQVFIEGIGDEPISNNDVLAEGCRSLARIMGFPFLELTVVSTPEADVVISTAETADAVVEDTEHRRQVARALASLLSAVREEVAV